MFLTKSCCELHRKGRPLWSDINMFTPCTPGSLSTWMSVFGALRVKNHRSTRRFYWPVLVVPRGLMPPHRENSFAVERPLLCSASPWTGGKVPGWCRRCADGRRSNPGWRLSGGPPRKRPALIASCNFKNSWVFSTLFIANGSMYLSVTSSYCGCAAICVVERCLYIYIYVFFCFTYLLST